jgi:branched-chain amino acid transport system ATP-binding protein
MSATLDATPAAPTSPSSAPLVLDVRGLGISFGGLTAVRDFCLALPADGLYGLIGPNGAGKTTTFNLLTGIYRPDTGSATLDGVSLVGLKPYQIARAGFARTFQNIRLFGELSVLDNVRLGAQMRRRHGLLGTLLRVGSQVADEAAVTAKAMDLLAIFGLAARAGVQAKNLPYGDQRRLEIARALATGPKVLLLDEPAAGMNPQEKQELMALIRFVRDRFAVAILLIEHDMKLVMGVCQRITVLDHGETIAVGTPDEIRCDPKVIEAYLGEPGEE